MFNNPKPISKGAGLGLSSIYDFAQQSGGNLTICSAENVGTTIKLYFPRSTAVRHVKTAICLLDEQLQDRPVLMSAAQISGVGVFGTVA